MCGKNEKNVEIRKEFKADVSVMSKIRKGQLDVLGI